MRDLVSEKGAKDVPMGTRCSGLAVEFSRKRGERSAKNIPKGSAGQTPALGGRALLDGLSRHSPPWTAESNSTGHSCQSPPRLGPGQPTAPERLGLARSGRLPTVTHLGLGSSIANRQALPYSRSMGSTSTAAFTWGFALRARKSWVRGADRSAPRGAFTTMW